MDGTRLWPGGPLFQDAAPMRVTTDSVLLADFAAVRGGEKGADLGCGSGLLMLLLLRRESDLHMAGLEIQPEALRLAEENLRINGLLERAELVCGDLRETVKRLPNGGFDFVISNPPYFPPESGRTQRRKDLSLPSAGAACLASAGDAGASSGAEADPLCPS